MLEMASGITGSADEGRYGLPGALVSPSQRRPPSRGTASPTAWVRRLAARAERLWQRIEERQPRFHPRDAGVVGWPRSVEARATLERVLDRMPEEQRVVYVLKEVEGYSHADIASLLGITAGASEARLHRARRYLRDRLWGRL